MNIKDKIAKLLALAESPNENEAKAALLKARELMAQHKLRPEECSKETNVRVRRELLDVQVSKTKYHWAIDLSSVIAGHYCCRAYRNHRHGERVYTIGFVGLEDDFEVCKKIFLYAFDCAKQQADRIFDASPSYLGVSYRRSLAESYGKGFVLGLNAAFRQQDREKEQEWGLVLVVPKAVEDVMATMGKGKVFKRMDAEDGMQRDALARGYVDGEKFDPSTKLESRATPGSVPALQEVG